tara:strand:- start:99 stop:293 length:195 start_codon:yes stop_codon:yes gene_type:complete
MIDLLFKLFKILKKNTLKNKVLKLMKYEQGLVQDSCNRRNWELAEKYLNKSKSSVKAYRRISKL